MYSLSSFKAFLIHVLGIGSCQDLLEIIFLAMLFYYFLLWLKKDTQTNLTYGFYCYCLAAFMSYYGQLHTLSFLLFSCAPVILMLFIMLHQEKLQKNFVTLRRIAYDQQNMYWFEEFASSCLHALNNNKELVCILEKHDSIKNLLYAPCIFHADFKKDIFEILLEKHVQSNESMIWINSEGKLVAINTRWHINIDEEWISHEARSLHKWKQDGLFITSKTDAIIFKISPSTRTFDIIMQGKLIETITPQEAFSLFQHSLGAIKEKSPTIHYKQEPKGIDYECKP